MPTRVLVAEHAGPRLYSVGRVGYDTIADDTGGQFTATLRTERFSPAGEGGLVYFRRVQLRAWHTGAFLGTMKAYIDGVQTQAYNSKFLTNGNMNRTGSWTLGTNWRVNNANSGVADQSAAAASDISQALVPAMVAGVSYEVSFTTAGVTTGTLTPKVGTQAGTGVTGNATYTEVIVAGSGDALLAFSASGSWDGTLDDVTIKEMDGVLRDQEMIFDEASPTIVGPDGGKETIVEMDISGFGTYIEVEVIVDSDAVGGVFLPESLWIGHRLVRPGVQRDAAST